MAGARVRVPSLFPRASSLKCIRQQCPVVQPGATTEVKNANQALASVRSPPVGTGRIWELTEQSRDITDCGW